MNGTNPRSRLNWRTLALAFLVVILPAFYSWFVIWKNSLPPLDLPVETGPWSDFGDHAENLAAGHILPIFHPIPGSTFVYLQANHSWKDFIYLINLERGELVLRFALQDDRPRQFHESRYIRVRNAFSLGGEPVVTIHRSEVMFPFSTRSNWFRRRAFWDYWLVDAGGYMTRINSRMSWLQLLQLALSGVKQREERQLWIQRALPLVNQDYEIHRLAIHQNEISWRRLSRLERWSLDIGDNEDRIQVGMGLIAASPLRDGLLFGGFPEHERFFFLYWHEGKPQARLFEEEELFGALPFSPRSLTVEDFIHYKQRFTPQEQAVDDAELERAQNRLELFGRRPLQMIPIYQAEGGSLYVVFDMPGNPLVEIFPDRIHEGAPDEIMRVVSYPNIHPPFARMDRGNVFVSAGRGELMSYTWHVDRLWFVDQFYYFPVNEDGSLGEMASVEIPEAISRQVTGRSPFVSPVPLDDQRLLIFAGGALWAIRWDGTELERLFPREDGIESGE